jgi:transcriptional regulator with XRE-family HTH domain
MRERDMEYLARQGAKIRSIANDIKRNSEALAQEIGEQLNTIESVLSGTAARETVERIVEKMADLYPLSRLDLEVRKDDTEDGVVIQSRDRSQSTSRVFDRADKQGQRSPYYEYRDCAMSSVGPYRPEWIKELRVVSSSEPDDPDVAYNNGHLMHQATFFIGPVNFYWKMDGVSQMVEMDTGDSNYITPFVPHSFTSRDASREALIIACTFSGKLETVQQEIAVMDLDGVEKELLDLSKQQSALSAILRREMATAMLGPEELSTRVDVDGRRLSEILDGAVFPTLHELATISEALGVNVRDLLPPESAEPREVVVKRRSPEDKWRFPSEELSRYEVENMAGSRKVPYMKGMSVKVLETSDPSAKDLDLVTSAHEFCYNYGTTPVAFTWQTAGDMRQANIEPGGSYYAKPTVAHALRAKPGENQPQVVIIRIGGGLFGDGYLELSGLPRESISRVFKENQQWYDPR